MEQGIQGLAKTNTKEYTVKPGCNALEQTDPRERYRRESVVRGKRFSGIIKRESVTLATFNDNPWTKQ